MRMNGIQIIESDLMVDTHEDWSQVRSPSRARRRRHKHPQRIVVTYTPKKDALVMGNRMVMHPVMVAELRAELARRQR